MVCSAHEPFLPPIGVPVNSTLWLAKLPSSLPICFLTDRSLLSSSFINLTLSIHVCSIFLFGNGTMFRRRWKIPR